MGELFQMILAHPERLEYAELPCCLRGVWEVIYTQEPALTGSPAAGAVSNSAI